MLLAEKSLLTRSEEGYTKTLSLEGFGDEQEKRKMHADVTVSMEVPKV